MLFAFRFHIIRSISYSSHQCYLYTDDLVIDHDLIMGVFVNANGRVCYYDIG